MLTSFQQSWGVDQWAAYLSGHDLPCMPRSKLALAELEANRSEKLSAHELAGIAGADPFLCVRLLREAERHRTQRLGHETTTVLAAVMQLGTDRVHQLITTAPETDESNRGLAECEARSHLASRLALKWGMARADISPDEIGLATLLSEIGELLLWSFAPEIPKAAQDALIQQRASRSVQAQVDTCGFRFKDLTLRCASIWHLPPLVAQLIRGIDNVRANLSRLCVDTARHLCNGGAQNPALPSDIADAHRLIPGAPLRWITEQLPGLEAEEIEELLARVASSRQDPSST